LDEEAGEGGLEAHGLDVGLGRAATGAMSALEARGVKSWGPVSLRSSPKALHTCKLPRTILRRNG